MLASKKFIRTIGLLVVLTVVIIVVVISGDEELIEKLPSKVKPSTSSSSTIKDGLLGYIPFLNNDKPQLLKENALFPLEDDLLANDKYQMQKLTVFTDPTKLVSKDLIKTEDDVDTAKLCPELRFEDEIQITRPVVLEAEYDKVMSLLSKNKKYLKMIEKVKVKFKSKIPPEKQWFRFAGSSVWLEDLGVHYMVSRLIYSPSGIPNKGFASFLYVQLFDRNWVEIDKTLLIPYEQQTVKNTIDSEGNIAEEVLDRKVTYREVDYPSVLPIEFGYLLDVPNNKYYYGPEDPRIIKRTNDLGFEEPIVVFNLKSLEISKRVMHMYFPFSNNMKMLKKRSEPWANIEKNWTPFISTRQPNTKLNFMYSVEPLEIVTCELDTGMCDFIQKLEKTSINYFGPLRGGSQLEQLPLDNLPSIIKDKFNLPANRSIYVGWARTHLTNCGCGESMYRPNLIILIEDFNPTLEKYYYKLGHVSDFVDFNADIPPWVIPEFDSDGQLIEGDKKPACDKSLRNVLIPNSIAYWQVKGLIDNEKVYNQENLDTIKELSDNAVLVDYMGVTLSAADSDVSVVHIKGMLNFISKIETLFDKDTVIDTDLKFNHFGYNLNQQCSEIAAKDYCVRYAELNGGLVSS